MRYTDDRERSAEYLRLALPLMTKQAAGLHPLSYAVWYEYVSGANPPLKEHLDRLMAEGRVLDDEQIHVIYRQFVAELDEEAARRVAQGFQQVLVDVGRSVDQAGDQASRFGRSLEQWEADLQDDAPPSQSESRKQVLQDTRQMQDTMSVLKESLNESRQEVERLRREVARARMDSLSDSLTGLANRKGFDQALEACLASQPNAEAGPSLLVADIDNFKQINDNYGHLFGDRVIRMVADILKANVKGKDMAARYGGEEFVVLLPDTPLEGAQALAEKIRTTIAAGRIRRQDSNQTLAKVTTSLGVSTYRQGESANEFFDRADKALYVSKEEGRNRVTVAPPPSE
ncbi:MAG TPA: GGDEF domain-containing protein [Rhodocyclaceae bacterium]|nr:GGDEF domain-containing protein [Rhodocyclaceae bacterium]